MEIREACQDDVLQLISLLKQLGYDVEEKRLKGILPLLTCWVAVEDGRCIGFAEAKVSTAFEGKRAELAALVVDETFRSKGVGAELVSHVEGWARRQGLSILRVRTQVKRVRAHQFYERLGFGLVKEQRIYEKILN